MIFCKNPSGAPFLFYRRQTVNLPPIQRRAAGGGFTLKVSVHNSRLRRRRRRTHGGGIAGVHRRECRRLAAETKGGKGTMWFPCPLLTPPNLPLRCDSLRSRSEMRGAHSDVWCTKGTSLMEAELFAAESGRPAPSGRALLCAANHASEIQGSSAAYKLKDARNRAPVPRLDARPKGVAS